MPHLDLSPTDLSRALNGAGLYLTTGPFTYKIRSPLASVAEGISRLYADYPQSPDGKFADFHVEVAAPKGLRRWFRPQVLFYFDGKPPFKPLPLSQALPNLEWGLNWCISTHSHQYLIIHAAAIERNGLTAILPAPPGDGKSTLCAALVNRGWRLLSDELAIVSLEDGTALPLARPINLKNESIDVIGAYAPEAVFSPRYEDTRKGTVALMRAPRESIERIGEPATPAWVIFPKYQPGEEARLTDRGKANTFIELGRNAFNYSIHGTTGFETLAKLVDRCHCYDFVYSKLDDAVRIFARLQQPDAKRHFADTHPGD